MSSGQIQSLTSDNTFITTVDADRQPLISPCFSFVGFPHLPFVLNSKITKIIQAKGETEKTKIHYKSLDFI